MSLIGLELSDAGIIAAAGEPARLLEVDGQATESSGFALPQKGGVLVGKAAESQAHIFPRQTLNGFWDQLNIEPIKALGQYSLQNHAEIAYNHLALIWQHIQKHGDTIVMAVPSFYDREQLGLILGITGELSMPLRGFIPQALSASSQEYPDNMHLHLDIHLHRIEVIYLKQEKNYTIEDSLTAADKGLIQLYRDWVETIAKKFVGKTRFDPLHQAASEQELYDRLPEVLSHFQHHPSMVFEISAAAASYSITLKRDLITRKVESIYKQLVRLISKIRKKHGKDKSPLTLQLTHRLTRLPGLKEKLATVKGAQIIELDQGAAALGVLGIWNRISKQSNGEGVSFFTSLPLKNTQRLDTQEPSAEKAGSVLPTHILYRGIAYPITERPLIIGLEIDPENSGIQIYGRTNGISRKHCSIELRGREIVLNDYSKSESFVDEIRVNESMVLKLGQMIRIGTPGEKLQLIACLNSDET
ncbi:MAG: FHA domain-containing protein [Desulfobacterales bacterium]|nr:FHA domain-containing protein [Desulfobacterales bacterium]